MSKLTNTQLMVLSKAAGRQDGAGNVHDDMMRPAAAKVGASLVARKLMREMRAKPGMPVWRVDSHGRRISLVITRVGRDAVEIHKPDQEVSGNMDDVHSDLHASASGSPRAGSKQAFIVEMLTSEGGATLDHLVEATGWLPHTTRAALTGLRKCGLSIERNRGEGKQSVYRIAPQQKLSRKV